MECERGVHTHATCSLVDSAIILTANTELAHKLLLWHARNSLAHPNGDEHPH